MRHPRPKFYYKLPSFFMRFSQWTTPAKRRMNKSFRQRMRVTPTPLFLCRILAARLESQHV